MTDNKSSEAKGQSVDTTSPPPNGPEQPSFFDDLATSMLTPGYIGHYTLKIVTYSIIAYSLVVIYRAIADPVFLNLISLISLIPALGLIITLRWYEYCSDWVVQVFHPAPLPGF